MNDQECPVCFDEMTPLKAATSRFDGTTICQQCSTRENAGQAAGGDLVGAGLVDGADLKPRTIRAIRVPADLSEAARVVRMVGDLTSIRAAVGGGYLEGVRLPVDAPVMMYADEDGKRKGLEPNARASVLAGFGDRDHLVGDALIAGSDEMGDEASVQSDVIHWTAAILRGAFGPNYGVVIATESGDA